VELPFRDGDRALLYTDGIAETANPAGVEFGTDCLKQFLAAEQSTSADLFAGQLLEELSRWSARGSAEDLDDDITMVAIHAKVMKAVSK
jgi:serine phosphatase RsbU (regulator of sigma subunit)